MYYQNSLSTAVEVIACLIDDLDDDPLHNRATDSCRSALVAAAQCSDLHVEPNMSIVTLAVDKPLPEYATAAAVLFSRAAEYAGSVGNEADVLRLITAEGMAWGAVAHLRIAELSAWMRHPASKP